MADQTSKPTYNRMPGDTIRPLQSSPARGDAQESSSDSLNSPSELQTQPTAEYSANDLRGNSQYLSANQPGMPINPEEIGRGSIERRRKNKMGSEDETDDNTKKLTRFFMASVIVVAIVVDVAEFLTFGFLSYITVIIMGPFFYFMFKRQGIDTKKGLIRILLVGGPLLNILPGFSIIPGGWTVQVLGMIFSVRYAAKIEKGLGIEKKK